MSLSIKDTVFNEIQYLLLEGATSYSNTTLGKALEFSKLLKSYKSTVGKKDPLYLEFKRKIKDLRSAKLPLRIVDIIKTLKKQNGQLPIFLRNKLPSGILQQKRNEIEALILGLPCFSSTDPVGIHFAGQINWVHGTNSAILPMLAGSDYTLISSGKLLEKGIAPMSGEIRSGGLLRRGVNQKCLSGSAIYEMQRSWSQYANESNCHFPAEKYANLPQVFEKSLDALEKMSPDEDAWDSTIITLLRGKQWDPESFQALINQNKGRIDQILQNIAHRCSYREAAVLKALDWNLEELKEACNDENKRQKIEEELGLSPDNWYKDTTGYTMRSAIFPQWLRVFEESWKIIINMVLKARVHGKNKETNLFELQWQLRADQEAEEQLRTLMDTRIRKNMIPFQKRLQRLALVFSPPIISLKEAEREMIRTPFPILLASTTSKAKMHFTKTEVVLEKAQLGKEVDLMFVESKHMQTVQNWLISHQLSYKVKVLDAKLIEEMDKLPLINAPSQVISDESYFSEKELIQFCKMLEEKILPLYKIPYPNGLKRIVHGLPHALRAMLFAQILAEQYRIASKPLSMKLAYLLSGVALHDLARKDDGVDLWDAESGKKCEEIFLEFGIDPGVAAEFKEIITHKDDKQARSLEHKILHDVDCVEILRELTKDEAFDYQRLWIFKELDQDKVLDLVKEAKEFISLTEAPMLKGYIEEHAHPYQTILHTLSLANDLSDRFPQMVENLGSAMNAFTLPSQEANALKTMIATLLEKRHPKS